ncbi:OmpA family protein [Spirosoma aerophilum]
MKWIKYVLIAGTISVSNLVTFTASGQPQHQVAPTDNKALVEGLFLDAETKKPIAGVNLTAKTQDGLVRAQYTSGADGIYQIKLDPRQSYVLTAKANGYAPLDEQLTFTSPKADRMDRKNVPILLYRVTAKSTASATTAPAVTPAPTHTSSTRVSSNAANERVTPPKTLDAKVVYTPPLVVAPVGKTTQLQALQFVQSKTELLPDAQAGLDQLLQFMQSQPTTEIELSGHTDNQGDFDQNLLLSKQRVDVVKAYLVKNGIAANRITTRGYGPTRPIASNNSETTRQLNRRVEMIVVKQ